MRSMRPVWIPAEWLGRTESKLGGPVRDYLIYAMVPLGLSESIAESSFFSVKWHLTIRYV